jgi:enoyl-CoA hydratase/carnithine racemase
MPEPIGCEVKEGIAVVTLNNPPLNLVTLALTRALDAVLDRLVGDTAVRVVVLTGAGRRAFCAGSDITEFPGVADDVVGKKLGRENRVYSKMDDCPKPTIAALNGLAYGGGLELAVCCDLVIAAADARLALPEIKLGVIPGSGGTVRVTRRVGEGRAKQMMFTGEPIDAETALAWGLIDRLVPPGKALEAALELAAVLAAGPAGALALCKQAIDLAFDVDENEAVARTLRLSQAAFDSDECREGVRAFLAKETPRFAAPGPDSESRHPDRTTP